jgi:hypothetical protein
MPEGVSTDHASVSMGEKRQGVSPSSSSADMPQLIVLGPDQVSAMSAGVGGPGKFMKDSSASTSAGLADTTISKAMPGQAGLRRAPTQNLLGPRAARLRPLTVGQVLFVGSNTPTCL